MTKLVEQAKPENFISYGNLKVAFYDAQNPDYNAKYHDPNSPDFVEAFRDYPKHLLYVHILLGNDDRSIVQRKADEVRVPDGKGGTKAVPEKEAYKRAYDLYLAAKEASEDKDAELDKLKAEITELKNKKSKAEEKEAKAKNLSEK